MHPEHSEIALIERVFPHSQTILTILACKIAMVLSVRLHSVG